MEAQFRDMIVKSFNFVLIFRCTFVCAYFILFAKRQHFIAVRGSVFLGAVIPMQILMPTLVFIGFSNITGIQILVPEGKEKFLLISICSRCIVKFNFECNMDSLLGSNRCRYFYYNCGSTGFGHTSLVFKKAFKTYMEKKISFRHLFVGMIPALGAGFAIFYLVDLQPIFRLLISAFVFFGLYFIALFLAKEPF